jgi:hypothetical protein
MQESGRFHPQPSAIQAPANVGVTKARGHKMPVISKSSATTDKIIEAASKLFSRQGYHGTSTRQIAQLAGVGENTLFRQFDHKEENFWSNLRYHWSGLKLRTLSTLSSRSV